MKRHISLLLTISLVFSLVYFAIPAQAAGVLTYDAGFYTMDSVEVTFAPDAVTESDENSDNAYDEVKNTDIYIDLTNEKLVGTVKMAAYSTDGGIKWTVGSLKNGTDLSKMLDKGLTLTVTSNFDAKTKKPTVGVTGVPKDGDTPAISAVKGGSVLTFPAIAKRPGAAKLDVNYTELGPWCCVWYLSEKGSTEILFNDKEQNQYQLAQTTDGKTVKAKEKWSGLDLFEMKQLPKDGKPVKYTFIASTAPVGGDSPVPAGKVSKITVSSLTKPVSVKVDYKKEELKLKAGLNAFFDESPGEWDYFEFEEGGDQDEEKKIVTEEGVAEYGKFLAGRKGLSSAATVKLGDYLDEGGSSDSMPILIWSPATGKKPASEPVLYKLAKRANELPNKALTVNSGKIAIDKTWQYAAVPDDDETPPVWGKFPKITGNTVGLVRKAATGKAQKVALKKDVWVIDDSKQVAAGWGTDFSCRWGNVSNDAKKTKMGVTMGWVGGLITIDADRLGTPQLPETVSLFKAGTLKYTKVANSTRYSIVGAIDPEGKTVDFTLTADNGYKFDIDTESNKVVNDVAVKSALGVITDSTYGISVDYSAAVFETIDEYTLTLTGATYTAPVIDISKIETNSAALSAVGTGSFAAPASGAYTGKYEITSSSIVITLTAKAPYVFSAALKTDGANVKGKFTGVSGYTGTPAVALSEGDSVLTLTVPKE